MNTIMRRVATRDHELLMRVQLSPHASAFRRRCWSIATHAGGAMATLLLSLAPLFDDGSFRLAAERSLTLLVVSHVMVQLLKRSVGRPRPARNEHSLVQAPDRFSFPSGHAAAATSVAIAYASVFPVLAVPILACAAFVGASRVVLGVHFPADVLAGHVLALMSAFGVATIV